MSLRITRSPPVTTMHELITQLPGAYPDDFLDLG